MPSHLEDGKKIWPAHVSNVDVAGNQLADKYASLAAQKAMKELPPQIIADVTFYYALVKRIQKRIIVIIQNLPERKRKQTVLSPKELKPKLDDLLNESNHVLVRQDGRIHCKVCLSCFNETDPLMKKWIMSACTGIHSSTSSHIKPVHIYDKFLHIGNQFIHYTHQLQVFKGLVYCGKCGYRKGTNQVRNLARSCIPPDTYGARNLKAILDGKLPHGLDQWPDQDDDDDGSSCDSELALY